MYGTLDTSNRYRLLLNYQDDVLFAFDAIFIRKIIIDIGIRKRWQPKLISDTNAAMRRAASLIFQTQNFVSSWETLSSNFGDFA